ncbi:MAG: HD-GYP domain-containing protein [Bacillota bacterium]|nr:HD-GYP domain-containing protein [Bacillota bacterium]
MKRVNISELLPGMITAEDVYNFNNQLILPRGIILNDKTITKLEFYSVLQVKVEDQPLESASDESPYEISYSQKIQQSPEFIRFRKEFETDVNNFKLVINDVVKNGAPLDVDKLMNYTLNILDVGATTPNLFDMLHNMRQYDDATYVHSMNVALICNVFARWLRMSEEETRLATISGLLHDIGKTKIPDSIIKKPGKLTDNEYDIVKKHPQEGYRILQNSSLDPAILDAVLMHHERRDGSGYPFGVTGDKIGPYAKMVSIADVYDAMTSARIYRGPLCPFKAISLFESEGLDKYDTKYIMTFLENVVNTYLLNEVRLNNGLTGTIVFIHKEKLSAPTIKTEHGFIDLSIHPDITIESLI